MCQCHLQPVQHSYTHVVSCKVIVPQKRTLSLSKIARWAESILLFGPFHHVNTQHTYTRQYRQIPPLLLKMHERWHPTLMEEREWQSSGGWDGAKWHRRSNVGLKQTEQRAKRKKRLQRTLTSVTGGKHRHHCPGDYASLGSAEERQHSGWKVDFWDRGMKELLIKAGETQLSFKQKMTPKGNLVFSFSVMLLKISVTQPSGWLSSVTKQQI